MLKNTRCLLTSYEEGALVQVNGIFRVKEKIDGNVVTHMRKLNNVKIASEAQHTTTLGEPFVEFATSNEGIVEGLSKQEWNSMSDIQRLRANLKEIVVGKRFTFKLL